MRTAVKTKMSIGKLTEFNVRSGNWTMYVERAEMFFQVNKVSETLWLPTLIAAMGDEAYELLSNLTSPEKPCAKTYAAVIKLMAEHLQPKPSFMAERYRFRQRRQNTGETVLQYISELKKMSKFCEFKAVLEENLRDQLVCGLKSETVRQRLFAEENLSYSNAVKISCAMEAAERDAAAVERESVEPAVHAWAARRVGTHQQKRGVMRPAVAGPKQTREHFETEFKCYACGAEDHRKDSCRYSNFICSGCKQRGHLRRVCPHRGTRWQRQSAGNNMVAHVQATLEQTERDLQDEEQSSSDEGGWPHEEDLHQLNLNSYKSVSIVVSVDGVQLPMEIDTGSLVSCISKKTYDKYFCNKTLEKPNLVFRFYDGSKIFPLGVVNSIVKYGNCTKQLELFVIEGGTTSLLGRQWLSELKIKIPIFHKLSERLEDNIKLGHNEKLSVLVDRYKEVFAERLGRFRGGRARLQVREGAVPVFCRARPVPYALRERVEAELAAMLRAGVIEPVETADWATPLVPVRKADGGLRICADYKVTLNPVLKVDRFPLPRIDDLLVQLNGAKYFTKIDLSQAYNQVELDDPDNLTVINTHKGLFKYKRLVYGLSSSPGIFQRIMSNLFNDIPYVGVFLDDIIIGTPDAELHLQILEKVFKRIHENDIKLKQNKCKFMTNEVKYLGFIISAEGIKVDPEKVEGILKIPQPGNITELRAFLGTINFYAKFVKNLSSILAPLYNLLKKGTHWFWDKECESAFNKIKSILISADVLTHYDPRKPLFVTCDASARGIGGVLSQKCECEGDSRCPHGDGGERPVVYVSRALTSAEKHYSQIEREALAIVFCLEKLHQYLYGRHFTLRTDHKPLVTIFGPKQGIPAMVASRLQRWAIKLTAYTYDIEYIASKQNGADGLSRLPALLTNNRHRDILPEQTYLHFAQNSLLLDYNVVKKQTSSDPLLSRVLNYIRSQWPIENEIKALQPFFNRKNELYEELGCVLWGHRVVIPEECKSKVLDELHESHMGIVKTKSFARSYVWWPGIDEAIETLCRGCRVCAAEGDAPPRQAPCCWPWPDKPWSRVHVDFLGPIAGKIFFVLIDARTKWLEVTQIPSTAASHSIKFLSDIFSRFGLPKQLVSDNGPPFTSSEFSLFLKSIGVEHLFSAPYHPASNGAAENAVRTVKKAIKKSIRENVDINLYLSNFLLHYRNTEHCTTGETPALLMFGRRLRTKLDALRPDLNARVNKAQKRQQERGSQGTRELHEGDEVWLRQFRGNDKWVSGRVTQKIGISDYKVVDELGRESHKHIDQLKQRIRSSLICPSSPPGPSTDLEIPQDVPTYRTPERSSSGPSEQRSPSAVDDENGQFEDCIEENTESAPPPLPCPPAPVTPQPRLIRQCRLNPRQYKY